MRFLLVLAVTMMACAAKQAEATPVSPAPAPEPAADSPTDPGAETTDAPACGEAEACLAKAAELDASDPQGATEAYYDACVGGAVEGCEQAGLRWQDEVEATADDPLQARIMDAFERSCELGGFHGCGNVGLAYFFGIRGVEIDPDKAVQYMTKSCQEQANKFVCRKLEQYENGEIQPGVLP
jgi:TPR repeat protein